MEWKLKKLALSKKVFYFTILILFIGSVSFLAVEYQSIKKINQNLVSLEILNQKEIIKKAFVAPLWDFKNDQAVEVANNLISNENGILKIKTLILEDSVGRQIFSYHLTIGSKESHRIIFPIEKSKEIIGRVSVVFNTEEFEGKYYIGFLKILGVSILISFMIGLIIFHFINLHLNEPLQEVLTHIKAIEKQNYNPKQYNTTTYEINLIGEHLNLLTSLVYERTLQLQTQNKCLEIIVADRTTELESMTMKNTYNARLAAVGEMAASVAHEINNPITVINGNVFKINQALRDTNSDGKIKKGLETIITMTKRIAKIVQGLKNISRNGENDPMVEFSVSAMLSEIKTLTEMRSKISNIEIITMVSPGVVNVYGREVEISQVLVNLFNNAIDAIADKNEKWIKLNVIDKNEMVEFQVSDSGEGIPLELQEKILRPFFTTKGVGKGTGLGLSISKDVILKHGGELFYNSKSKNTEFVFTLPRKASKQNKVDIAS